MKSLDESIQTLSGSRKMRALVCAMCGAAKGRMRGGQAEFDVDRGILQGDRLSPLLFIVCLAAMLKDRAGGGIEVGGIELDMLGCMLADAAEASSELANSVADKTGQKADMARPSTSQRRRPCLCTATSTRSRRSPKRKRPRSSPGTNMLASSARGKVQDQ